MTMQTANATTLAKPIQPPTLETPEQELARLRAENERLKAQTKHTGRISLKVSEKGAVSVYGLGRFPVTLYGEQWDRLLSEADNLRAFLRAHAAELSTKN